MGIWDLLYSAKDKLKQNAPNLTPVTNACQSSYRASCTVASNVYKAVTVDGAEKVKDYLPDSHTQEKIKRIAKEVAVPELLRFTRIRGLVQSYRILRDPIPSSVHAIKKFEHQAEELKLIQKDNRELRKLREEVEKIKHDNKILKERIKRLESLFLTYFIFIFFIFSFKKFSHLAAIMDHNISLPTGEDAKA